MSPESPIMVFAEKTCQVDDIKHVVLLVIKEDSGEYI